MGEIRPISLIHSVAKLISKVLSLRLSRHMNKLVSKSQSAFINRRCLQDNFLYMQNLVRRYHRSKTSVLMLKLDIAKAFYSVSWPYLMDLLQWRGFEPRWREWIAILLGTSSSTLVLNGVGGSQIQHRCGVRQGDSLSPIFLF